MKPTVKPTVKPKQSSEKKKHSTLEPMSSPRTLKPPIPRATPVFKPNMPKTYNPPKNDRTFNEHQIVGNVNRDNVGCAKCPAGRDLDNRRVTHMGYLLDEDGYIVSNEDPNCIIFKELVKGNIPAPHMFERFNFSAFDILG